MLNIDTKITIEPKDIKNAMVSTIAKSVSKKQNKISRIAGRIFVQFVKGTDEWISLSNFSNPDSLAGNLGMDKANIANTLSSILDAWADSFTSSIRITSDEIIVELNGVRGDYSDVLNLEVSSFTSKNGFVVPWLRWLLMEAQDFSLVPNIYRYKKTPKYESRSGLGIMIKAASGKPWNMPWTIPAQFAKPEEQNFVSRIAENEQFKRLVAEGILNELLR